MAETEAHLSNGRRQVVDPSRSEVLVIELSVFIIDAQRITVSMMG